MIDGVCLGQLKSLCRIKEVLITGRMEVVVVFAGWLTRGDKEMAK